MIYDFIDILTRRLLAWSLLSIAAGVFLWLRDGRFWQGFAMVSLVVGIAYAVSALMSRRGLGPKLEGEFNRGAALYDTARVRRSEWINTWLDFVYIGAGLLLALAWGRENTFLAGAGWGLTTQGAFLFLFDLGHALGVPEEITLPDLGVFREPQHEDFWMEGGPAAAIVVHGFPGTPDEMRTFADALHEQGWSVRGLLLPGYGARITSMFQVRLAQWVDAIAQAVTDLKQTHGPVLLVGYSMGGGLSILAVASGAQPDALALLAPFWWYQPPWSRPLLSLARLFLPLSFKPLPRLNLSEEMVQQALKVLIPTVDLDTPEMRAGIREFRAPLFFLDMFRRMGIAIEREAKKVRGPILIVQGSQDPVVRPVLTRKLAKLLCGEITYQEVDSNHEINLPGNQGNPAAVQAVLAFAEKIKNGV